MLDATCLRATPSAPSSPSMAPPPLASPGLAPPGLALPGLPPPGASATDAQSAYDAGDFAAAYRMWSEQAQRGDPRAAFGLGLLYDLGQDVPQDPAVAFRWYWRAADGGLPAAEFNVAVMYDSGVTVPRNAAQAGLWYARAAAHGHGRAQYNLAQLYAIGDGVPRNATLAAVWYRAAAAAGLQAATAKLTGLPKPPIAPGPAGHPAALVAPIPYGDAAEAGGPPLGSGRTILLQNGRATLELAWQAPPQPVPVHYYIEVAALADPRPPRDVFTDVTDRSASLVMLQVDPGRYLWRVYSVSEDQQSYAASAWTIFTIAAGR